MNIFGKEENVAGRALSPVPQAHRHTVKKTFCTTREAAQLLGISVRTAQLWVESGQLKGWKTPGGHRRVLREAVERLLHKPAPVAAPVPEHRFTVLVVDDDRVLLRLYEIKLAQWPMAPRVITAHAGVEALVQIGREKPDLLIADLQMPRMDGFHMLRGLRAMPELASMSIVVVSGLDQAEIARRGGVPADIPLLPKPIPFDALLRIATATASVLQTTVTERAP